MKYTRKHTSKRIELWGAHAGISAILAVSAITAGSSLGLMASIPAAFCQESAEPASPKSKAEAAIEAARDKVQAAPQDAKARFDLGKLLRLAGQQQAAASEFLEATSLDPGLYVAYHELYLSAARPEQIDEAIDRLNVLKEQRPKDLLLRVGLSELLEKRGETYKAAKTLVDLVYEDAVPEKYMNKVNSRIHYLLSKTKESHAEDGVKTAEQEAATEDTLAPPLPEASLKRNLAQSKGNQKKVMQNFGHAPLEP